MTRSNKDVGFHDIVGAATTKIFKVGFAVLSYVIVVDTAVQ